MVKFSKPRESCMEFMGISSVGSVFVSRPLAWFAAVNISTARGGTFITFATKSRMNRPSFNYSSSSGYDDAANIFTITLIYNDDGSILQKLNSVIISG